MLYVLIGISLVLASFTGLQFLYMAYLDNVHNQRKGRLRELERQCKSLSELLSEAEARLAAQDKIIGTFSVKKIEDEEVWADVLDER